VPTAINDHDAPKGRATAIKTRGKCGRLGPGALAAIGY